MVLVRAYRYSHASAGQGVASELDCPHVGIRAHTVMGALEVKLEKPLPFAWVAGTSMYIHIMIIGFQLLNSNPDYPSQRSWFRLRSASSDFAANVLGKDRSSRQILTLE